MEPVGIALGAAALFSSCIECFELFKAASDFDRKFDLLLVKLEIEQERLLVWGDVVGLGDRRQKLELSESKQSIVNRGLQNINRLLEDTETLTSRYGVRKAAPSRQYEDSVRLTTNALKRFRLRFKEQKPIVLKKTQWAISDATKFEILIKDLRELIDGLTEIVPAETQAQKMEDDVAALVDDLETLELLSEACGVEYPSLQTAAGNAIEASEYGTFADKVSIRTRTFPLSTRSTFESTATVERTDHMRNDSSHTITKVFFILTNQCLRLKTDKQCDDTALWRQVLTQPDITFVSQSGSHWSSDPGNVVCDKLDVTSLIPYTDKELRELHFLLRAVDARSASSDGKIESPDMDIQKLSVYIYCAPCACQIRTAKNVNFNNDDLWWLLVYRVIRVDYRLVASCCADETNRINGIISLMQGVSNVDDDEDDDDNFNGAVDFNYLDLQAYNYAEDQPQQSPTEVIESILAQHKNQPNVAAVVFQGETDYNTPLMKARPFPPTEFRLPPSNNQMFMMHRDDTQSSAKQTEPVWKREYIGSYPPHVSGREKKKQRKMKR